METIFIIEWGTMETIIIIKMRGNICWIMHYAKHVIYLISIFTVFLWYEIYLIPI